MTFPTIVSVSSGHLAPTTSHALLLPTTQVGDMLVLFHAGRNGTQAVTPSGWTKQHDDGSGSVAIFTKVATGAEGGTSPVFASSAIPNAYAWALYLIRGTTGTEFAKAGPNGGTVLGPALTPSWGAGDILWIVAGADRHGVYDASDRFGYPSGYTADLFDATGGFDDIGVAVAHKSQNVATQTAATWTAIWQTTIDELFVMAVNGAAASEPTEPPPYVAPRPGAAVVEIYAAEPGAYRWGTAIWGDPSVWSTAGWRDVTPEAVDIEILWGSQRPELGILSKPEPSSWGIDFYDPGRTLDPSNEEGPYFGDLEPGLPVRVRHGNRVIRQGIAESIGYQFSQSFGDADTAYFRVTDIISTLANARVPSDSVLSDTLSARARDAISAAGVVATVLPDRPDGDPVLAPWVTGQDRSAWEWIVDAAESVLHVPIITNVGHLGFRAWAEPFDRARRLGSPNLVGLQSIIAHNGLYSVVTALQSPGDGGAVITRELTPKPRYGARQYDRDEVTPNAGDWAQAVLTDRAQAGLRWVPGEVYPLTAADVDYFASLEQLERVGLYYPEADPAVVQDVVIVGGRIAVTAKRDSEAIWSFEFQAAQTAQSPLIDDDTGLTFLVRDDDPTEFLYPDG